MTSLSLILLFAVAQALVCLASPSYQILEVEDEKDVMSEDLKMTAEDKEKEEVESFNDDNEELKAEEVRNNLLTQKNMENISSEVFIILTEIEAFWLSEILPKTM
ncbi:unnamed protein product [Dibothriocephalus latus]|uniref:Uncharacterized protein n=1 Tax=Dibothriocephalus latus TaxID=60516 RepID=A0A3P6TN06_DIBLA|nr:unnamed protein product [Dibothriocephalus latus]